MGSSIAGRPKEEGGHEAKKLSLSEEVREILDKFKLRESPPYSTIDMWSKPLNTSRFVEYLVLNYLYERVHFLNTADYVLTGHKYVIIGESSPPYRARPMSWSEFLLAYERMDGRPGGKPLRFY